MSRELFRGSAPAVATPMHTDGSVDYVAFENLLKKLVVNGVKGLVINGTTAEATTLTSAEKTRLVEIAVKVADHKIPVIAGAGSNNTAAAIEAAKEAKAAGADALLLVTPYYNKTSQRGLIAHYSAIVESVKIPAILYNVPGRTGMTIAADTVVELAKNPYIVAIKEASGNMAYVMEVLRKTAVLDFSVYSGEDGLVLPVMAAGGKGVISVVSNIYPKEMELLCQQVLEGNLEKARSLAYDMDELVKMLFADVNPICVKAALSHQGFGENVLRLPLIPAAKEVEAKLYAVMAAFEAKGY